MYDQKLSNAKRWLKSRRSQRIDLNVPVVVYRPPSEGQQFYESTQTLMVSAHGALMVLADNVAPKQRLLVQNIGSGEQQRVPRGLRGENTDGTDSGCSGIHTAHTQLLAHSVPVG
jgi:hypothetical protein